MTKEGLRQLIEKQCMDEGLWFVPVYVTEDILQRGLRQLHAAVEEYLRENKNEH